MICQEEDNTDNTQSIDLIEVKVVQDDDGHNYIIPASLYDQFSDWMEMDPWYQDEEKEENRVKLDRLFEDYRTSGDLPTKLFAQVGYEKEESF